MIDKDYITRETESTALRLAKKFPVLSITGPRQSGKSTLAQHVFPDYAYVSLENPNIRSFALEDPMGFITTYPKQVIIDEAQRAPELFNYLQEHVDKTGKSGQYVLSGHRTFCFRKAFPKAWRGVPQ